VQAANDQVWVYDLRRGTLTPLTLRGNNGSVLWTPDGHNLTLTSDREGRSQLFRQPADGSGTAERLTSTPEWPTALTWSPDGETLLFDVSSPSPDIWMRQRDGQAKPLLQGPFSEDEARFSPNGRWLAYVSDESGRSEVYVKAFPGTRGRSLVSTDGGRQPVWGRNGRELFYRSGDRMMAVPVTADSTFSAGKPVVLFVAKVLPVSSSYDVTPDGDFLMIERGESDVLPSEVRVVLNWSSEIAPLLTGRAP
jgi:Tol biopolymer transport system component